jgi:hypothetical protein
MVKDVLDFVPVRVIQFNRSTAKRRLGKYKSEYTVINSNESNINR